MHCRNDGTGTELGWLKPIQKDDHRKENRIYPWGNRGLGLQTARELGKLGILVVIGSRDLEKGKAPRRGSALRARAESLRCDVTKPEDHRAVRDHLEQRYGKLDIPSTMRLF